MKGRINRKYNLLLSIIFGWTKLFSHRRNINFTNQNKILVLQSHLIGDLVLTSIVFESIKRCNPNAKITLLANPFALDLFKYDPNIDKIEVLKFPWAMYDYSLKNIYNIICMIFRLRKICFDISLDFRGDIRNIILMWLIGAKNRISYNSTGGEFFLSDFIEEKNEKHLIDYYRNILDYLGCSCVHNCLPILYYSDKEEKKVFSYLNVKNIKKFQYVVINPRASYDSKNWDDQKFLDLAQKIETKFGYQIVWNFKLGEIPSSYRDQKVVYSSSLVELFPLLKYSALYVGLDSGVAHISASYSIPSVVLFGPQDPKLSHPINENMEIVMKDVSCRPCGLKHCKNKLSCMDMIDVEDVIDSIDNIVSSRIIKNR